MKLYRNPSLKKHIVLITGCFVACVFLLLVALTSLGFNSKLEQSIYHDVSTKNHGYVYSIYSMLNGKAETILSLRDNLELYDNSAQMWLHLASYANDKIFEEPIYPALYEQLFEEKLAFFKRSGHLSDKNMTPHLQKMLDNIYARKPAFDHGIKFFYLGANIPHQDYKIHEYLSYQDSSLWVPDEEVDELYDPLISPWYLVGQQAARDTVAFTEPYAESRTFEAVISLATPINVEGVQGTLAGAISIKPVMDKLLAKFPKEFHQNSELTVFSKGLDRATPFLAAEPKYVYSSRESSLAEGAKVYNDIEAMKHLAHEHMMELYDATRDMDSGVVEWVIDGDECLVAFSTVPNVGWKVFNSVPKSELLAGVNQLRRQIIFIAVFGTVLLLTIIATVVTNALRPLNLIGKELDDLAKTGDLNKRVTVTKQDEIGKMARSINKMLDNTAAPVRELGKRVNKIAQGDLSIDTHIEAKGDIEKLALSFSEMTKKLIELEAVTRDSSPLTGLPGGITIEGVVQNKIEKQTPFAFCLFDLDNFKPFNDRYGYSRGNLVIKYSAQLIKEVLNTQTDDNFIGHIGGDDFVVVASPDAYQSICEAVIKAFDKGIWGFYDEEDRMAEGIISKSRKGKVKKFPVMTMSVCAVSSTTHKLTDYIHVGEIIAELKSHAKKLEGSNLVVEKRSQK